MSRPRIASAVLLLFWMIGGAPARAESILLTPDEAKQLAELVKSNVQAKRLFTPTLELAKRGLNELPSPIEAIRSEGLLQSDPRKQATLAALADMPKMRALALAWVVTKKPEYLNRAKLYILAWAKKTAPTGDAIDATKIENLIIAYDLTRGEFTAEERTQVDAWLKKFADLMIAIRRTKNFSQWNNWHSHRLKIIGLVGYATGDEKLIEFAHKELLEQIAHNLHDDGSSSDFHDRDAVHYHQYTLTPLLTLAIALDKHGHHDLYAQEAPNHASLKKSVAFLVPYADGTESHEEYVNSKQNFDRSRGKAGEKGFKTGAAYNPLDARPAILLAAYFDPKLIPLACKLTGQPKQTPQKWRLVAPLIDLPLP